MTPPASTPKAPTAATTPVTTPVTAAAARTDLARRGERLAAVHLRSLGMEVLAQNWRCPIGEADLVLRDGDDLVVCEVKTRRALGFGDPLEAITRSKHGRLRRLAAAYLAQGGQRFAGVRLDAVGILWPDGRTPTLRHVKGLLP